ncbi:hypothetical protein NI382_20450 [Vibrio parahaemolyticus]|nr:hypothetical protein NI382_20450 [Vibrio parahaemolyticus]
MRSVLVLFGVLAVSICIVKWLRYTAEQEQLELANKITTWRKEGLYAYFRKVPLDGNPYLYQGEYFKCDPPPENGKGLDALAWEDGWWEAIDLNQNSSHSKS